MSWLKQAKRPKKNKDEDLFLDPEEGDINRLFYDDDTIRVGDMVRDIRSSNMIGIVRHIGPLPGYGGFPDAVWSNWDRPWDERLVPNGEGDGSLTYAVMDYLEKIR